MANVISALDVLNAWGKILERKDLHTVLFTQKLLSENKLSPKDLKTIFNQNNFFLDNPVVSDPDPCIKEVSLEDHFYLSRTKVDLMDYADIIAKRKLDKVIKKGNECKFSVWDRADGEYTTEEEPGEIIKVSDKIILLSNFIGFIGEIYTHKAKSLNLKTVYEIQNFNPVHYNYDLDINFKDWKFAHIIDDYSIINGEITSHYSWPPQILSIKF